MQLRPRDGNGRAITSKDGLIRSFKQIIDRDQLDPMPEVPVKGGEMYYFKTAKSAGPRGEDVVKMVKYDPTVAKEKKVPKFKDNYNTVDALVALNRTKFEELVKIRKLYVDSLGVITDEQFKKMCKKNGVIADFDEKADNFTNHEDLKTFVTDAITEYKKVHPNRPIKLSDEKYQSFINKVLMRVREQYYVKATGISFTSNKSVEDSVYSHWKKTKLDDNATDPGKSEAALLASSTYSGDIDKLNKERKIITVAAGTDLTPLTPQEISGEDWKTSKVQIFSPLTQMNEDLQSLKELIEELYKIFIEQTEQKLKADPVLGMLFADGGKKKGGRSGKMGRSGKKVKKNRSRSRKH